MRRAGEKTVEKDFTRVLASPTATFEERLTFFRGRGMIQRTLKRIAADVNRLGIDYCLIGAVALNQHGYRRFTEDIGLLMTREGLETLERELVGRGYRPAIPGARKKFRVSGANVPLEIVTSGAYPGDGLPKPVVFPDPAESRTVLDGIPTLTLEKLIELKLASGMSAPDRLKDLADVQELIRVKGLDAGSAERLNRSVREKYRELQQAVERAARREDG